MSVRRSNEILLIGGGLIAAVMMSVFAPLFFGTRVLSEDEIIVARSVFAESVDIERVRIKSGGPLTWFGAGVTIGNVISFPKKKYDGSDRVQPWLVHELTHVWQYQHHGLGYIPRSVWEQMTQEDAYAVQYDAGKSFLEYDIEEQAVIVADNFVQENQRYAPYILELRGETR
ncbi:DUF4157 domain-containing protein [Patescibacteria group bacterium]